MQYARVLSRPLLAGLLALSLASCDPRDFDDLADEAWVHAAGKPGDVDSAGFGIGLVAGGGDSLHYIVAGEAPPTLTMAKFDRAGARSTASEDVRNVLADAEAFTYPLVMASDASSFAASNGNVAVATFNGSGAALFMMRGENGSASVPFNLAGSAPASGLAFGATDASADTDLIAVSGSTLNIIADYQSQNDPNAAAVSCAFIGTGGGAFVADVDAAAGDEILFAIDGELQIASASALVAAANAAEGCFDTVAPLATIAAPAGEASFGTGMLLANLDGNGTGDLVVSAPEQRAVYVYFDYATVSPSEPLKIDSPANATQFGVSIAAGDFDGDGRDELVIGDPAQRADGHARAGIVYLYSGLASASQGAPIELHDASPVNDQRFGQSLAVTQAFGGANLVVGAKNEVFTYFRTPLAGDDDFRN